MRLNTCNIPQTLAIIQPACFHKLAKANIIMESQSRGAELTIQLLKAIQPVLKWSKLVSSILYQTKLHTKLF